jgi:hypothetical protein
MLPRRLKPRQSLGCILAQASALAFLAGAAPAVNADHPPELRKLHALLVIDTLSGLGESVKIDGERIDHLLSQKLPRDRVEIVILTGKDVNTDKILAYYKNLKVGADDALFFYYAGHGATDPEKGDFMALQGLHTRVLVRADLRRAMLEHQTGLVVLMTDCCSDRHRIPGKLRRVFNDAGEAKEIDPLLRCLFYRTRGIVDITASNGESAFGDDHEGGIFTRTFAQLVAGGPKVLDTDRDGVVTWREFFPRFQAETESVFVTWAARERARGEAVTQTSQKPHAFELGGSEVVRIRNEAPKALIYYYRWSGESEWRRVTLRPHGADEHTPPHRHGGASPTLEVRFEGGKTSELKVGKTYRFHDSAEPNTGTGRDGRKP